MDIIRYDLLPEAAQVQLGLIVLQSDVTIEDEFRYYFADQSVSLFVNRIPFENEVNADTLQAMEGHIANTMSLFPINTVFDALGYACTSGAMHIGGQKITTLARTERDCKFVSNPLDAAVAALKKKQFNKVAYLGPYSEAVCNDMIERFKQAGIDVIASASYNEAEDRLVGRISPETIRRDAIKLAKKHPDLDAVFISCTNMKCAQVIPNIESATGIAAVSSNQALAWSLADATGLKLDVEKGSLFKLLAK